MFQTLPKYSPVAQDFIWVAEYADGTHLSEFDFKTHQESSFYDIKKSDIIRFGLIGLGNKLYFESYGGSFNLNGQMIDFVYLCNSKNYHLTGLGVIYNDLITYKNAETYANLGTGQSIGRITQYNFGYKNKIIKEDVSFNFQTICQIPYNNPIKFNIKLVSNKDLDGQLIILRNGTKVDEFNASLRENIGGELNWILK